MMKLTAAERKDQITDATVKVFALTNWGLPAPEANNACRTVTTAAMSPTCQNLQRLRVRCFTYECLSARTG